MLAGLRGSGHQLASKVTQVLGRFPFPGELEIRVLVLGLGNPRLLGSPAFLGSQPPHFHHQSLQQQCFRSL